MRQGLRSEDDLVAFLGRIAPPPGQLLELRTVTPDGPARGVFCGGIDLAISAACRANGQANVYVGACPRRTCQGSRSAIDTAIGCWADLDFKDFDPQDRTRAHELALARLGGFTFQPTILVHTGNGLQAWWLFSQPVRLSAEFTGERLESINRGLAKHLAGDHVHDLARVLRVPGTINLPDARKRARGCVPVMARLLLVDGPTYEPEQFRPYAAAVKTAHIPGAQTTLPVQVDRADAGPVLLAFEQLLVRLGPSHPLTQTWRGERALADQTRSGWDMALANQLYRAGIREEYVPILLTAYPLGKAATSPPRYLSLTLAKARSWMGASNGPR